MSRSIETYPTKNDLVRAAADRTLAIADAAVRERTRCAIALSGGSTPKDLFALFAAEPYRTKLPWNKIHLFWGDERTVPPDHADSNFGMACKALLDKVPAPPGNVHRIHGEDDPHEAAKAYRDELAAVFGAGVPVFDLVFLGMGPDGHTASLFPRTKALDETRETVVANEVPQMSTWRITLTYPVLNAARNVIFLVAGPDKADRAAQVLGAKEPTKTLPSSCVRPSGSLVWMLDEAAAAKLER